jgi:hypothetical protein
VPPIAKPGVYIERSLHAGLDDRIQLVDERLIYSLQQLCLEDARNDIFKRSNHRFRERWQRTTVHFPNMWIDREQPHTVHDVRLYRCYSRDIHTYVDYELNFISRKPFATSTNADIIEAQCGRVIHRLLSTIVFSLCMVHHLDQDHRYILEAYGMGFYEIYYHNIDSNHLYWIYNTDLK